MTLQDKFKLFKSNVGSNWTEVSSKEAPYQCMDLAYLWVFVLNYPKATIQNALAYQVYTAPKAITKEYFYLIENTPSFVPQVGDIVVWDKKFNGTAGHIAIATGEGNTNWFNSYDQNIGSDFPQVIKHTYTHVLGVLRPKVFETDELAAEYKELRKKWDDRDEEYDALVQANKDLRAHIKELNDLIGSTTTEAIEKEISLINKLKEKVSSLFKK